MLRLSLLCLEPTSCVDHLLEQGMAPSQGAAQHSQRPGPPQLFVDHLCLQQHSTCSDGRPDSTACALPGPASRTRSWGTRRTRSGPRPPSAAAWCSTPCPCSHRPGSARRSVQQPCRQLQLAWRAGRPRWPEGGRTVALVLRPLSARMASSTVGGLMKDGSSANSWYTFCSGRRPRSQPLPDPQRSADVGQTVQSAWHACRAGRTSMSVTTVRLWWAMSAQHARA